MKKKIINGLLFAVALVTATSSFVSCKDYEGDNYNELQQKYASLADAFKKQVSAMQDYVLLTEAGYSRAELSSKTIKARLDELNDSLKAHRLDINNLTDDLGDLQDSLDRYIVKNDLAVAEALGVAQAADSLSKLNEQRLKDMLAGLNGTDLADAISKAAQCLATVAQDSARWNETAATVEEKSAQWDSVYNVVKEKSPIWDEAVQTANKAWDFIKDAKTKDGKALNSLQDLIDYTEQADEALVQDIQALNEKVNALYETIRAEVTGIEIQAAYNPVYGTFAYPAGIQSNVLALYYGEIDHPVFFPAGDGEDEDFWVGTTAKVSTEELKAIGYQPIQVEKGIVMDAEEGNAGQLYLTVNPSNVNFEGKSFSLRASDNTVSKVQLSDLQPCTEQLKWGYRRANSVNGFYVANATVSKEDVKDVVLSFDLKSVGQEAKAILDNWRNTKAADVARLAVTVADAMKADVPRLGVQTQWKDATGWKNYVSKYDLAAVSVKPVGYDFLYNRDFSGRVVKIHNKITNRLRTIEKDIIDDIKGVINISIGLPESKGSIYVDENDSIWLTVGDVKVSAEGTPVVKINPGTIAAAGEVTPGSEAIPADTVKLNVEKITVNGTAKVPALNITPLFSAIKNSLENSISKMNGKADTLVHKYIGKVIDFENKIFNKIERVAKNPNRYIQPALIAKSGNTYFYPSRIYFSPTKVKKGQVIKFYPTTLTGEVLAPAYKKYVAILNDKSFNTGDFNKVVDGTAYNLQNGMELDTNNIPAGTVLEFIYETLGYNGKIAGKKYYIEITE
jgi:ribosomal protein L12E/L44/L45/RPP1/RPP2